MVWAPNVGITYPFSTGLYPTPTLATDPANFNELDTNGNGVLDYGDDPYLPFYPGNEHVDWVGLSMYWYPSESTGFNVDIPSSYFFDHITGQGPNIAPELIRNGLANFYERFAAIPNKPMMIPETGAPYFENEQGSATELEIKQVWWRQVFSTRVYEELPLIKLIIQFEEEKIDDGTIVKKDWRILENRAVRNAFKTDIAYMRNTLLFSNDLKYTCSGKLEIK
jgi:hypothetical protein